MKIGSDEKVLPLKVLTLIFIFLAMLNTINAYYYFVFIGFGIFVLRRESKMIINGSFCALLMLAVSFVVFSPNYSYSLLGMLKPFTFFMCYVMGCGLFESEKKEPHQLLKSFYTTCICVVSGSFVHYLLNWLSNLSNLGTRNTIDFWTKTVIAATGQAPLACLSLALAIACLFSNVSKKIKLACFAVLIVILAYNLVLSGRTLFIMAIIVFFVAFVHKLRDKKANKLKYVVTVVSVILIIVTIFNLNIFGARSYFESSQFYERFYGDESTTELDEDGRMDKKIHHIKNAPEHLFGGSNMHEQLGYAHDIYLDTYDEAGIFALLSLLIYIVATIYRMIRCVRSKDLPFELRQIVLCVYAILYIQFMTEPILQGVQWLFASFCVIDGSLSRLLAEIDRKKKTGGSMQ